MPMKIIINVGEKQHNFLLLCEDICQNIAEVKQFCYCRFPQLQNGAELRIFWNDQDGDEICVVTDDDYKSFMLAEGKDKRRLYVEAKEAMQLDASVCPVQTAPDADTVASRPVHQEIICDVCDREIVGHRYRCLTCYDYDLCMTCESKYRHKDHIMLRIPQPLRSRTLSHRVLERMERYASKLDLIPADGDVDGKKFVTVEVDYSTDKIRDKARRERLEKIRSAVRDLHNAEGKPTQPLLKAGSSTRSREQTKRCKTVKVVSDSVKELKRAKIGEVANEKVKERAPVPLPWVNDFAAKSSFCRRTHVHRPNCPYSIKPEAASSLPLESLHCSGKTSNHANQPGLTSARQKCCKIMTGHVPEPSPKENAVNVTSPTGSMVSVLVDGVLKHTPPEFKKFLPTDEEMNRVGEKLSTLLGHLGLELKIPPTENEEASSSTGTTVAQAGSTVSAEEKEACEVSVAAADNDKDQSEPMVVCKKQETVSQGSRTALETEDGSVGASSDGEKVQEQKASVLDNDECSADTSSASMLTDDEGDGVEAEQVSKQSNSSAAKEVPWILVDLPEEEVKQNEDNNSPTTSSSTPVASAIPSASSDKEQSMEIEESEGEPEDVDVDAIRNLIEYTKMRLEMLKKNSLKEGKVDDRVIVVFEKLYKDLEKLKFDQKEEESNKQMQQENNASASVSVPTNEKKFLPEATTSSSSSSSTTPIPPVRTSSVPKGSNAAAIAAPRTQTAAAFRTYSRRPHVNDAIHTMMTMGFNNNDGRLTQLLEAFNGDIPRALDRLLQKVP